MNNKITAQVALDYAQALFDLEAIRAFRSQYSVNQVDVHWHESSACGGYKEMSCAVSVIVSTRMTELMREAEEAAEVKTQKCAKILATHLKIVEGTVIEETSHPKNI